MAKYYLLLFVVFGGALYYVFLQDPCNRQLRSDFAIKYPGYEILDSGAGAQSTHTIQSVHCHVRYRKPDEARVYEDVWLYENLGSGWSFSRILQTEQRS
ncbi:MAG: hypothetical protein QF515_14075 [Pseudomonadales bacterium]|jgi:hypothetical protein|nr:hypothetical protein [Pseudomonadales bacterium]MDP6472425.1 hypothetical protein [Pseudomonadales bacterium]MDP6828221.1 hypothetical protein [Pseudomonadales bacterium]|tara:strand:+ start:2325 stop:2621 length:297 start_codon:yes stop_codon:yes gene_type:complete